MLHHICLKIVLDHQFLVKIDQSGREVLDLEGFLFEIDLQVTVLSGFKELISEVSTCSYLDCFRSNHFFD